MSIRIYGKELNKWTYTDERGHDRVSQIEIAYKDITEDGETKATGSEDFSWERHRNEINGVYVYTWDGERRNKGGYRWFDCRGYYKIRKTDRKAFKEYMRKVYNAEVVELR